MARKRMLDPDFFLDEEVSQMSPHARLLYQGLWCICDDNNHTFPHRPGWIKLQVFPYEPAVDVGMLLQEIARIDKILPFMHQGKEYWYVKNFSKHQRVDHPSKSKYPKFDEKKMLGKGLFAPLMTSTPRVLRESSGSPLANELSSELINKAEGSSNTEREKIEEIKKGITELVKGKRIN